MKRNRKSEKLFFTLLGAVVFCFSLFPVLAKDDAKYRLLPESSDSIPEAIIWPPYFQKTEQLNRFNLKVRLFQSSRLLMGVPQPPSRLWLCYRMQKLVSEKITSASQEIISSGIKWLDNDILFGDGSALAQKLELENRLTGRTFKECRYKTLGDLQDGVFLYCETHGMSPRNKFYIEHKREIEAKRPFWTASNTRDLLLFLPGALFFLLQSAVYFRLVKKS